GYSACHWCHVMAQESFADPQTATVMNALFVNIKVDREERPDIDQIYQTAHQLLTQRSGGWPLTMFLTPDQKPFFGGTYFPRTARHGLPGFVDLLQKVASVFRDQRREIELQNESLIEILSSALQPAGENDVPLGTEPIAAAVAALRSGFDAINGGIGNAPKFPHPFELAFCLRSARSADEAPLRDLVLLTLRKMAQGGIYDQLGGGFCRYSTDARWLIPHFEKMLYDNGPLLRLYADAWVLTGDPLFKRVCEETAGWVMREMQSPEGGYYSSLDADSEHEEGKFYVWQPEEFAALLDEDEVAIATAHYGLDGPPNFEHHAWNPYLAQPLESIAARTGRTPQDCESTLRGARAKLFAAREKRVHPGRDEKILVSWNALMVDGMTHAARIFGRADWQASARKAVAFLASCMFRQGRLLATYKDGRAHLNAYLDDYAFLLNALIELLQADYVASDVAWAKKLADTLLEHFEDPDSGGFYFTSDDHEPLILRPKPAADNATPSGNGMAALALTRLGYLLGEERYLRSAQRTLAAFRAEMLRQPGTYSTLCTALAEVLQPTRMVVLRGPAGALPQWQNSLARRYMPDVLTFAVEAPSSDLPGVLNKPAASGTVNAYLCRGVTCLAPVADLGLLTENLAKDAAV
ncbi:MAG: thioredoxin domain-containing protein, partial [Betaproteobacteria bacterium]